MKLCEEGKTSRPNNVSFAALAFIVFVATAIIASCSWNLEDSDQLGRLKISLGNDGNIGALDISEFSQISFVVVEADYFRNGGRAVYLGNAGFETDGPPSSQREAREAILASTTLAEVFTLSEVSGLQIESVPGGFAQTWANNDGIIPSQVTFPDLVVGKEYVVWLDGLNSEDFEDPLRLGFATARIRSGADTTLSINLTQDRFPQFAQLLYDRYVEPFLPPPEPIDIGDFDGFLYQGSGSAIVTVQGEQPREVELDRGWIFRFPVEDELGGTSYNVFVLGFYSEDVEVEEIVVVLLEDGTLLEPSRASYQLQIASDTMVFPEPGTIFEVDLYLEDGRDYYLLPEPTPSLLGTAGFSGGSPSGGGAFSFGVSGTFEEFDLELANIEISNLTFNYGELLETFDDEFGFGFE